MINSSFCPSSFGVMSVGIRQVSVSVKYCEEANNEGVERLKKKPINRTDFMGNALIIFYMLVSE